MSILREVAREAAISGLRLKRRLGGKILIKHSKQSEVLTLQVIRFESGYQVVLAFEADPKSFEILREEMSHDLG